MKHKVSELEGALLDAAVAKALGRKAELRGTPLACHPVFTPDESSWTDDSDREPLAYSTSWKHGGPIIERERISLISPDPQPLTFPDDSIGRDGLWHAEMMLVDALDDGHELGESGATPLIAAMRAYCASKFGDEVDLP